MGPVSGAVLYVVIWFLCFFVALPMRVRTQGDAGEVVPGTHAGAPQVHHLKKKAKIVTLVAFVIWGIIAWIILSGRITVRDLEWLRQIGPQR